MTEPPFARPPLTEPPLTEPLLTEPQSVASPRLDRAESLDLVALRAIRLDLVPAPIYPAAADRWLRDWP
jgi:hypothetical protein